MLDLSKQWVEGCNKYQENKIDVDFGCIQFGDTKIKTFEQLSPMTSSGLSIRLI